MERKDITGIPKRVVQKAAVEAVIFCGKPEWIERWDVQLGLKRSGDKRPFVDAMLRAAGSAEIVYGDYDKGLKYTSKALKILDDPAT